MDFASAAHELYGVAPDAFMETRKRLVQEARAEGEAALAKRIGTLRRPTLSAWAVNLLGRSAGEELGWLLDVGEQLRGAWASGGSIGGLEQRRGELVRLLVRRARELAEEAGHPLREPAVREVEDTLQAATVDADVAEEVRQGRLAQPRSHAGFVLTGFPPPREEAEPAEPTVEPEEAPAPKKRRAAKGGGAAAARAAEKQAETVRAEREKAHRAAQRKAEQADRDLAAREAELGEAHDDLESADADVGRLRRELDRAVARQESAARRVDKAERLRDKAAEAAGDAHRRAGEAARAC
ncbi:hypothetical protein [Actinomadura rugatobispora]|uniref:Transposase n=1 Tax=Actinomadura rugatobispora TaxID=1994 RepID=A0ABW0ZW40_9ACTN|nr:hypothetical protein GCM10010200_085920 [Actinomadura rugatobispora]